MFTQAQQQALQDYKKALNDYNNDKITYEQYVEITFPLWNKINILFNMESKK